ncbi:putative lipoprotein [Halopseudomonas litoralis]|uniref:Putative lipoprotein n=1 Tax=Halopseudomonas litoralis TaxID=797277 RepID=A0A1H1MZA4_9GAMM|nr:hypothetical protein [Halopseudomonas litoralis]SDR91948.1 putative lipoprotein [Halopseudomonas litoralis]
MAVWFGRLPVLAGMLFSLTLTGCASWSLWPVGQKSAGQQRVSGLLERGDHWTFRPCGQEHDRLLQPTPELEKLFDNVSQPGQLSMFAELVVTEENGRWIVQKTHRLQSTGRGCMDNSAKASQWVGFSYDPAWRVDITAQGMQLTTEDAESGRQLSTISEQLPDGVQVFRGVHDQGLELWLYPSGCIERSTGDYHHLSATLVRDGQRLRGCGYQGAKQ